MNHEKPNMIGSLYDCGGSFAGAVWDKECLSPTLMTMQGGGREPHIMEVKELGNIYPSNGENGNIYETDGLSPTIKAGTGVAGNGIGSCNAPKVLVKQATKEGTIPCKIGGVVDLDCPTSQTRRGRVIADGEISPTLTTESIPSVIEPWIWEVDGVKYQIRILKLTPRECWSRMDFNDGAFDKAAEVNSNTQLYKQAGNSIVVNCLVAIIGQMIEGCEDAYKQI